MDATDSSSVTGIPTTEPETTFTSVDGWVTYHANPYHKLTVKSRGYDANDVEHYASTCSCGQFRSTTGTLEDVTAQAKHHRQEAQDDITLAERILMLELDPLADDSGSRTVRQYLANLLITLWAEKEHFSGKRPFGVSGWQYDIYAAMVKAGLIAGKLDGDEVVQCDAITADTLILKAIRYMCGMSPSPKRARNQEQE